MTRKTRTAAVALAAGILLTSVDGCYLHAQSWGSGPCPPVGRPAYLRQIVLPPPGGGRPEAPAPTSAKPKPPPPRWWGKPEAPGEWFLYQGGKLLGKVGMDGQYRPWSDRLGIYTRVDKAPVPPPAEPGRKAEQQLKPWQLDGVDKAKMGRAKDPPYSIRGKPVTREEAVHAITTGELKDDTGKFRLTIIGQEAARKKVLADLESAPELAAYRNKLLVQAYPPDHWQVKRAGFVTAGAPTIYCQGPDGKVLHRQDDYNDGAKGVEQALKKAYDPAKDPDLRKPAPGPAPGPDPVPPVNPAPGPAQVSLATLLGAAGILLVAFLLWQNHTLSNKQ